VRRFTYASGTSHKFWSIGRDGSTVTVHFGRVGTAGQKQVKDLASDGEAEAHVAKLVTQKTKKGYVEDAGAAATVAPVEASPASVGASPARVATRSSVVLAGASEDQAIEQVVETLAAEAAVVAAEEMAAVAEATLVEGGPTSVAAGDEPADGVAAVDVAEAPVAETAMVEGAATDVTADGKAAEGVTSADAEVAVAEVAVVSEVVADEDVLVFPDSWHGLIHPRRGGRFVPTLDGDPAHAWRLVDEFRDKVVEVIGRRGGNGDVGDARTYLDERVGSPKDAAVVATIVGWAVANQKGGSRAGESAAFVDTWVADHGLVFAARAVMERQPLFMNYSALQRHKRGVRVDHHMPEVEPLAGRLRAHLAMASDDDHRDAVDALGEYRRTRHDLLVTAFLVPERKDWVDAAAAVNRYATPLLAEAVDDLEQLTGLEIDPYQLFNAPTVVPTLLDGVGPAVAPFFAGIYDQWAGVYADEIKQLLAALALIPTDEAFDLLLRRAAKQWVRPFLQEAMNRFPVRAARKLASAHTSQAANDLLRAHARIHADLLAKAELPATARARLAQMPAPAAEADPASLPALLVDPPWHRKHAAAKPVVVAGLTSQDLPPGIAWLPGERDEWANTRVGNWDSWGRAWESTEHPNQVIAQFRAGKLHYHEGHFIATAPDELTRPVLAEWRPSDSWYVDAWAPRIVARYELDALPALFHLATHGGDVPSAEALLPFVTPEIAALMADWQVRLKTRRPVARAWLQRHQETAARALVPAALGKPGKERRAAEAALRLLDPPAVTAAATEYGERAAAAIAGLLATDPLDVLPARIPATPAWLDLPALPQLILRDGGTALPRSAVTHVVTMLAMSKPDEVYAGVDVVKELCTPASLAEFAWALFAAWQSADMPAKHGWALTVLGRWGDDETVRRLTPLVRAWPGEGGHTRAVNGLDVLAAIGTDVALMHLHGIAQKVKFTGLRTKAREKITQVAAGLELTPDQLADRLVPDLGLDDDGSMVLDYGPRRFVVGFDERLVPYVVDESGARRKDLPKPGVRDDQDLAQKSYKRFAALKKDVRTFAADQVRRLQQAMVDGRRWTATEFTDLFVGHPVLRHVVRRLVWAHDGGEHGGDAPVTFRVAEDRTLAGVTDDTVTLPAEATVGIVHPLHLGDELAAWAEIFADYEILQPFPQLGRPVHALTAGERTATELATFTDIVLPTGKVLGLTHRGWQRATPGDGGVEDRILRPVPGGRTVIVELEPGIAVGVVDEFPEQKIQRVWLNPNSDGYWYTDGALPFGELDPVTASEVLAELTELTGTTR
jgi:predicted DNA-binding WGR domain protein